MEEFSRGGERERGEVERGRRGKIERKGSKVERRRRGNLNKRNFHDFKLLQIGETGMGGGSPQRCRVIPVPVVSIDR